MAGSPKTVSRDQLNLGLAVPRSVKPLARKRTIAERDLATRPHTRLKLESLRIYLPEWFGVMSNRASKLGFRDAWFVDAFAGSGRYKDGPGTAPGSPVIACEAARDIQDEAHRKGRQFTPHLRFIEIRREVRRSLAKELKRFDGVVDYAIVPGDAMVKLPGLIAATHPGDPLLLFVDPDGFAPVTFALIAGLGTRPGMTEVLLSIDALGLRRAHARSETTALSALSGGTWWEGLLDAGGLLDVNAYLGELRRRILATGFRNVGYRHLRFLSESHNYRAIIQACGSPVARQKWAAALDRSASNYEVIADLFPDLDRRQLVDATIEAFRGLAGQEGLFWGDLVRQLDSAGVEPNEAAIREALYQLRELGLADFDQLGRGVRPPPRFAFRSAWPPRVSWDGVERKDGIRPRAAVRLS